MLVASTVFYLTWTLLGARGLEPEGKVDAKTLFDMVKLAFGVVAGAGALVALVVTYRRQRVDEDGALRDATRLHTERFTAAVTQLEASPPVRLGGVHALAGLADDAPTRALRQTCIDVLCAYLRLPYTAEPDTPADTPARHEYLALREVRHTAIRLIRDHLRLPEEHPHSWQGHDFDFTGAIFDGGDFSQTTFSAGKVDFTRAQFSGGTVDFGGAKFSGATAYFTHSEITRSKVHFNEAEFSGGTIYFNRAQVSAGKVDFTRAQFSGSKVRFSWAQFSGGTVNFTSAEFSGATVLFDRASFSGGTAQFTSAQFSGGTVNFHEATLADGVSFNGAQFTGGTADLGTAHGTPPAGLPLGGLTPPPAGLVLPPAWCLTP
ncbi:pentapeptide repeat-containing protein [Streptomyces aureocirculatus]|uniref:pentapeptide repeat-containing protein n=1 Tax=Streptomyces aureocirculatus TaxID=67275 RepID=UPI001CECC706|nr:pentapeptide repeat-containing protein [Streptomyces aureocirculatus]